MGMAFVTILATVSSPSYTVDNLLTIGESAGGEKQAAQALSPRRPPRRCQRGVQEIVRHRTSPRRSGGEKSAVRSMLRLTAGV